MDRKCEDPEVNIFVMLKEWKELRWLTQSELVGEL
jgi:hypothetical protein